MEEATLKMSKGEAEVMIARRLETMLRLTREDEVKLMRIIKMRRLERLAKKVSYTR